MGYKRGNNPQETIGCYCSGEMGKATNYTLGGGVPTYKIELLVPDQCQPKKEPKG